MLLVFEIIVIQQRAFASIIAAITVARSLIKQGRGTNNIDGINP